MWPPLFSDRKLKINTTALLGSTELPLLKSRLHSLWVCLSESRRTKALGAFPLNRSTGLVKLENQQMLLVCADKYLLGHIFSKVDQCNVSGGLWFLVMLSRLHLPPVESPSHHGGCIFHFPIHCDAVKIWRVQNFRSSPSYPPRTTSTPPATPPSLLLLSTPVFHFSSFIALTNIYTFMFLFIAHSHPPTSRLLIVYKFLKGGDISVLVTLVFPVASKYVWFMLGTQ